VLARIFFGIGHAFNVGKPQFLSIFGVWAKHPILCFDKV
jgi:hypothetical protein